MTQSVAALADASAHIYSQMQQTVGQLQSCKVQHSLVIFFECIATIVIYFTDGFIGAEVCYVALH